MAAGASFLVSRGMAELAAEARCLVSRGMAGLALVLLLTGCGNGTPEPEPTEPVDYELDAVVSTTLQQTWAPRDVGDDVRQAMQAKELRIIDIDRYAEAGLGAEIVEGQPWVERDELAPEFVQGDAANRRSLCWFWQASDTHMTDEESPIRFEGVFELTHGSTFRPHSHLTAQVFESLVRSARRIADLAHRPLDFALITGDISDGGQRNELEWGATIMNGGVVDPDTGLNDDPVPGPGNDASDPFRSQGVGVPWYAVVGNHEVIYSGAFEPTPAVCEAAVGDEVFDWFAVEWGLPGVEGVSNGCRPPADPWPLLVTSGQVVADPAREILPLEDFMQVFIDAGGEPAGHGFSQEHADAGVAYYSVHPVADLPLRLLSLSTIQVSPATDQGQIDEAQLAWLQGELADAESAGDLVIVAAHHPSSALSQESFVSPETLRQTLAASPNVILYLTGHGHGNWSWPVYPPAGGGAGYWELMLTSTTDFPVQTRFFELVYEGNGFLSVYLTNLEPNAAPGSFAWTALDLAAAHRWFGEHDARAWWEGMRSHMNLLLRLPLPEAVVTRLEAGSFPAEIVSEQTLATL